MEKINISPLNKNNLQATFAWLVYFFINILFCVKYNPFEKIEPFWFIIGFPLVTFGIYKLTRIKFIQQKNVFFLILSGIIILFSVFLLFKIDRYSLEVDRWSALAFWSESLKNGIFPYSTLTHLGHQYASPFPVWQFFHFPFHLMGDTGYGQIFCLLVFFIFLFSQRTRINIGGFTLLLAMSPAFWWEIAVRSDLLCNMLLVFVFLVALFYYSAFWEKHKYLAGLIIGLFLCTKLLVAIPLFIFVFPKFLSLNIKEKILFSLVVIAGFVVPFIPFLFGESGILNHPEYNPLMTQSRQGNIIILIIGFILIIWASLSWKKMRDCFFFCGLFLFLLIFSVGFNIYVKNGFDLSYIIFQDEFDKSYFSICLPFFLFCINEARRTKTSYKFFEV